MAEFVLEDAREYVIPIFTVRGEGEGVYLESRVFLGTAFFVTKRGDAITAGHVIPRPDELTNGQRLVAIVQKDGEAIVCWITHAAKFDSFDLALVHVNLENTKYLDVTTQEVSAGTDVQVVGIPSHEVWGSGKEMRLLKGHVTLSHKYLELNFPVPAGMSGSPLFVGTKVAGYLTGTVRSEETEETTEEVEEVSDKKEIIRITESRRIIHYGLTYPFSRLKDIRDPVLDNKTLFDFITQQNREP
jgi:V8-like Glu-specific endopeptidase